MRRLRPGLAAMTTSPALDWLDAQFEQTIAAPRRRLPSCGRPPKNGTAPHMSGR